MERYTLQQRIEIIKIHYKNGENLAETVRKTRQFLGRRKAPCQSPQTSQNPRVIVEKPLYPQRVTVW